MWSVCGLGKLISKPHSISETACKRTLSYVKDGPTLVFFSGALKAGYVSTGVIDYHLKSWEEETRSSSGRSLWTQRPYQCQKVPHSKIIPGLHTLTQIHTLRPADGHQRDTEIMTQFLIMWYFLFLQDEAICAERERMGQ